MEPRLLTYLDHNEGDKAWFAIPGGLIAGVIEAYDPETGDFGLQDATYFTGTAMIDIGNAFVLASEVSAWGDGIPTFSE